MLAIYVMKQRILLALTGLFVAVVTDNEFPGVLKTFLVKPFKNEIAKDLKTESKARLVSLSGNEMVLGTFKSAAQDNYLMPSFAEGTVYFRGQVPAKGILNISAVDHSLRFLAKDGTELVAVNPENIVKVMIDTVMFMRYQDMFYRMFPLKDDVGIAVLKTASVQRDAKQGAYGTTSQTSAVKEFGTIYSDGIQYNLGGDKNKPYTVSETIFIYRGDQIYTLGKRGLKKLFPESKDRIDAYFKDGGTVPETVEEALQLLASF